MIFSGAETESDIAPPVLEENKDDVVSATKTTKSLDGSALKTGQEEEGPEEADATEKAMEAVDNVEVPGSRGRIKGDAEAATAGL